MIIEARQLQIPIFISDNGSSDGTVETVENLRSAYPHISFHRFQQNEGFDRNIASAVSMATTEYVWLMSDDDVVAHGALTRIHQELSHGGWDLLVINREERDSELNQQLAARAVGKLTDEAYRSPGECLQELAWYMTYIGALAMRRSFWSPPVVAQFLDSDFVHVGVVFSGLQNETSILFISEPLVISRMGNFSWEARHYDIWFHSWPRIVEMLPARYEDAQRIGAVRGWGDRYFVPSLVRIRARNQFPAVDFWADYWRVWSRYYGPGSGRGLAAILTALVPSFVARAVVNFHQAVKHRGRATY